MLMFELFDTCSIRGGGGGGGGGSEVQAAF